MSFVTSIITIFSCYITTAMATTLTGQTGIDQMEVFGVLVLLLVKLFMAPGQIEAVLIAGVVAYGAMVSGLPSPSAFVIGLVAGFGLYVLNVPVMTIGIGVYLPFLISAAAAVGGLVKCVLMRTRPKWDEKLTPRGFWFHGWRGGHGCHHRLHPGADRDGVTDNPQEIGSPWAYIHGLFCLTRTVLQEGRKRKAGSDILIQPI